MKKTETALDVVLGGSEKAASIHRRVQTNKAGKVRQAEFAGFVNVTLTEQDKALWGQWVGEEGVFDAAFLEACESGFKFTVSYDDKDECFRATAACWLAGLPGAGRLLTIRGKHPSTALSRVVWVLVWKLGYELGEGVAQDRTEDKW